MGHAKYAANKREVTRVAVSDWARGIIERVYNALTRTGIPSQGGSWTIPAHGSLRRNLIQVPVVERPLRGGL